MKKFFKSCLIVFVGLCIIGGIFYFYISTNDWFKTKYKVTFNANGGICETTTIEVEKDSTIELPITTRVGYDFEGWFCDDIKWLEDTKVTKDTVLVAKWKAQEFDITFIVEGVEYIQKVPYDTIPEFDGVPTKEPTTTIEYVFTEWEPELVPVSGEATYTAKFSEQERKYKILATKNFTLGGVIVGAGFFPYQSSTTLKVVENKGYTFVGWYKDDVLYSASKTIQFDNIDEDITLEARFNIITKNITYISDLDVKNSNRTQYNITDNVFILEHLHKNGYDFNGWFTGENGTGTKVEQIDSNDLVDYTLYADWDIIVYTISYDLNGGNVVLGNPTEFTVETETFTLNNPTRTDFEFLGWYGTDLKQTTLSVTIEKGTFKNLQFTAVWHGDSIVFTVDGVCLYDKEIYEEVGSPISAPDVNGSDYGMSGYEVDGWYTDEACTKPYTFTTMPSRGITLYGTWVYTLGEGFYPYLTKFNGVSTQSILNIDSYAELVAWVEYVKFYNVTAKYTFNLTYPLIGTSVRTEIANACDDTTFKSSAIRLQYTYQTVLPKGSIYVFESHINEEATMMYGDYENYTYEQLEYSNCQKNPNTRSDDYNEFKINNVNKTLRVSTSTQLVYALEKGLRPICVSNSSAERVYNKAKEVLRQIVDDGMDDVQKLRAIYEWLIMNVEYDNRALDFASSSDTYKYKTFYADGVFDHGVAVCAGFAESLLIMAKIENIPTIYVTGNNHAWNKVLVNGIWYGIDATHGNLMVSETKNEILSYNSFLFTDAYKISAGYSTQDYSEIKATTVFNIYDYLTIENTNIDLLANSDEEACQIVSALKDYESENIFTIEIALSYNINAGVLLFKLERDAGVDIEVFYLLGKDSLGNNVYAFLIA